MTSSTRDGLGGYSDTLSIHYAETLTGPWTEHAERPALVDAGLARPGGAVVRPGRRPAAAARPRTAGRDTAWAWVLAEIDRLDRDRFVQTIRATVSPGPHWGGRRLHTVNRAGRLEVIDGATALPRLSLPRRR